MVLLVQRFRRTRFDARVVADIAAMVLLVQRFRRTRFDARVVDDGDFIERTIAEDREVGGVVRHDGVLIVIEPGVRPLT